MRWAVSRQISIGDFRRRIRPSAAAIRQQKLHSSSPPSCARGQYRIYSDNAGCRTSRWATMETMHSSASWKALPTLEPRGPLHDAGHTQINEVSIKEISFQPPQTTEVMIMRTKRLAVNSSRAGCAAGRKSKPSSDSRGAPREDCNALSARKARVPVWAMRSSAK
jgi:hypothetical protein